MQIRELLALRHENMDVQIHEIFPEGWRRSREFSLYKTKARPSHALFFVCSEIEVTFYPEQGETVTARQGDVVWIPQGSRYEARVSGSTAHADTYTVNLSLWDGARHPVSLSKQIAVIAARQDSLLPVHLRKLNDAFHRVEETGKHDFFKTKGAFFTLLDLIAEAMEQSNEYYYPIRRGVELFCREWSKNERIGTYAALCGVSETYFYRCFRKWSGNSPVEYRNLLRLSHAENLLRCTNMQIREISEAVGFEDPFYFCRLFSDRFGRSPRHYRNQFQKTAD